MNARIILWFMALLAGCSRAGQNQEKGKGMRDQIDKLLAAYSDVYEFARPERMEELESKIAGLDFDGIHIGVPDSIKGPTTGIPLMALSGNTLLRAWEVNQRSNAIIAATDVETGKTRFWPLYPPPVKKLKPMPKPAKPTGEAASAREYGCLHRVIGESDPSGMPVGEYAISVLEWDRTSNIETLRILGKPDRPPEDTHVRDLPWSSWESHAADFLQEPQSPRLAGATGLVAAIVGNGSEARILVSFALKSRESQLIRSTPEVGNHVKDIRAAVAVEVVQLTLDKLVPEVFRILAPIHHPGSLNPGDLVKGWLALPLAKMRKQDETQVYVFADGLRAGAIRVPAMDR
jgi:hypothetical protein